MTHMAIGHEIIAIADASDPRVDRAAVDRDAFPKDVVVADFQASRLSLVLQVLRPLSQNRAGEDLVLSTHNQRADQVSVRPNDTAGTDSNWPFQNRIRTDLSSLTDLRFRRQDRRRMHLGA